MPVINLEFKFGFYFALLMLILFAAANCRSTDPAEPSRKRAAPSSITSSTSTPYAADTPLIVAFGDSLTAGYGLPEPQSYPALLQRRIDERGYHYRVVNAGVSGDTSAGGVRRIDWALKGDVRFLILELGANDMLRGLSVAEMKRNLATIIERAQSHKVTVILAGMEAPPNLGPDYRRDFRQAFSDLARQYELKFIPFLLANVGGLSELNQADGIHPNARGTEIVAENLWRALEPLLVRE